MFLQRYSLPKPAHLKLYQHTQENLLTDLGLSDGALSDMEMKKKLMMMNFGKCAVDDWQDWSGCSVTCGVGMRVRSRTFTNPMVDESMCPGVELMEKENCIGACDN